MGMRAVANIAGQDHYLQWGSPAYQIEAFAVWLHSCASAQVKPTAESYRTITGVLFESPFSELFTGDLPGDLDWTYVVAIDGTDEAWSATLEVRGPKLWSQVNPMRFGVGPVAVEVSVSNTDLSALDAAVSSHARDMADQVEALVERGLWPEEKGRAEVKSWRAQADRWAA